EVEVALGAEAAAEQRYHDAHLRLRDLQDVRNAAARDVRHLGRRPDGDTVSVPFGDDRSWLDRNSLHRIRYETAADDDVRGVQRCVGVALDDRRVAERVSVSPQLLVPLVRLPGGVDGR